MDLLIDFFIHGFTEVFGEWFCYTLFGGIFRKLDEKHPEKKALRAIILFLLLIVSLIAAIAVSLGIVFLGVYIFTK